jgi:alpha-ketoglutarate-dependent taurine dioxygenase
VTVDTDRATRLRVRPLTGRIGAELSGVHLANLDDDDVAGIRQALLAHRVVFLRDQSIGAAQQIAFASRLGPLTLSHPTLPRLTEDPEIFDLDSIAGATANHWHTDVTFVDRPPHLLRAAGTGHSRGRRRHSLGQHGCRLPRPAGRPSPAG